MDPPRRAGFGVHTQTRPTRRLGPSLSTAPASPQQDKTDEPLASASPRKGTTQKTTTSTIPPYSTLGHLSFTPATQQTVVTTTTTTTVSLPPLLIRPPRDITVRDPKQYPLAFSPTPHSIKRFCFDVGGRPAVYREADDVGTSLDKASEVAQARNTVTSKVHLANFCPAQYNQQQSRLQGSNGTIRQETSFSRAQQASGRKTEQDSGLRQTYKRPASPPSLAEAAEIASQQRRKKKQRATLARTRSGLSHPLFVGQDSSSGTSAFPAGPLPVTPGTDIRNTQSLSLGKAHVQPRQDRRWVSADTSEHRLARAQEWQGRTLESRTAIGASASRLGPAFAEGNYNGEGSGAGATATPPVADDDLEPAEPPFVPSEEYRRPLQPSLLNSSQQDASLPSPSLSPVTAAANLARSHQLLASARDATDDGNASEVSGLDLEDSVAKQSVDPLSGLTSGNIVTSQGQLSPMDAPPPLTLMDVPTMIETFDALPDDMQTYVLYQFLRRSQKKTLQVIASVVNPALKCDPFDVLPVELGLQITKFLDARSLCRAAQVSKKWRQLIDSDERAWKELLDRDGYELPEGEIERAVREGWAWQNPGLDGSEEDLGALNTVHALSRHDHDTLNSIGAPSVSSDDAGSSASTRMIRTKRKSTASSVSHKRQKRKTTKRQEEPPVWLRDLGKNQGPIAYASAAAKAVPNPNIGLPSLSNIHLFKSIYQRHYMIAKSWMDQESQPHHLAFRAHHRHVVTCLLFDSDKILTGSDDTNINVYDTQTGILRKRLEGHEGGVWALQYEGDTLVSGSTDRSVRVWDIPSGKCLQTFQGHTSTVRCLVILKPAKIGTEADGTPIMMPKEPLIITGSRDSTLRVWKLPQPGDPQIHQAGPSATDTDNPYSLRVLQGHHNSVRAIAAHGDTLVSGSYDCTVRIWKISTGELLHSLRGHTQKVYSVVLDHDRGRCISGSMDNLVKVWSIDSGMCLFNLEGHTSLVGLLDLSHERLVSAAADSTLRIWHPETGQCLSTLSAHTGAITCFQHDDQKVISGSDRTLKMWNVKTGKCIRDLLSDLSGVWQVRFDERRCVAAVQRNNLTYIEVLDFGAVRDGVPEANRGRRIAVNSRGHEIEDIESTTEATIQVLPGL
ncbi:hypothetical protein MBLNU459_g1002t2 [Dothideomycetes sp. NU459]